MSNNNGSQITGLVLKNDESPPRQQKWFYSVWDSACCNEVKYFGQVV